ncbi:MAG: hypothetical protein IJU54_01720 [Alphaproteobacteria bacterium]|nr:hypothetical protein [Alphaproteobacteria bacterium]
MFTIDYIIKELIEVYIINGKENTGSVKIKIRDKILKYITKAICDNACYFDYNTDKDSEIIEKNEYIEILKLPVAQEKIDHNFSTTKNIMESQAYKEYTSDIKPSNFKN